jgi:hypothetical protein
MDNCSKTANRVHYKKNVTNTVSNKGLQLHIAGLVAARHPMRIGAPGSNGLLCSIKRKKNESKSKNHRSLSITYVGD